MQEFGFGSEKLFLVKSPGSSMSWRAMCDDVILNVMFVDGVVEMWNDKLGKLLE